MVSYYMQYIAMLLRKAHRNSQPRDRNEVRSPHFHQPFSGSVFPNTRPYAISQNSSDITFDRTSWSWYSYLTPSRTTDLSVAVSRRKWSRGATIRCHHEITFIALLRELSSMSHGLLDVWSFDKVLSDHAESTEPSHSTETCWLTQDPRQVSTKIQP